MTHQPSHSQASSTFLIGLAAGALGLYLLGTKHGRKLLKQAMDAAEELEKSADSIADELGKVVTNELSVDSIVDNIKEKEKQIFQEVKGSNMYSIMEKIKNVFPEQEKKQQKYVSKDGVIMKD